MVNSYELNYISGVVKFDMNENVDLAEVETANKDVKQGGEWSPHNCTPWQRTAIIVPFRDRWHHFKILLKRLHPMLSKQKIHYQIFLIEQVGTEQVTFPVTKLKFLATMVKNCFFLCCKYYEKFI